MANDEEAPSVGGIHVVAALLALTVGWIHVLHPQYGISNLLLYLDVGTVYDPRPPAFVVSGAMLIAGVAWWRRAANPRRLYLAGAILMTVYLGGYVAWHTVLDHGAFWPHLAGHHHHDSGVIEDMVSHLQTDRIAAITKAAESTLLVILVYLLIRRDQNSNMFG